MVIENIMYFALGLLVAGLVALIILPAVWKRAVRLTKRRIEAATPITMAEFRADKDQLRAEFALTTRRLEINIETLRKRLAEQLGDFNQKRSDLGQLTAERDQHLLIVAELETRATELRARVTELERDGTDLAQRLRMRDRDFEARGEELEQLRAALREPADQKAVEADDLGAAEARIANAEHRLNAILAETSPAVDTTTGQTEPSLAEKLSLEAEMAALRQQVGQVETTILADWESELIEHADLRDKLNTIATNVSRLVYADDTENPPVSADDESLFDRVQRFADDGEDQDRLPNQPAKSVRKGSVTDRMTALREIQGR